MAPTRWWKKTSAIVRVSPLPFNGATTTTLCLVLFNLCVQTLSWTGPNTPSNTKVATTMKAPNKISAALARLKEPSSNSTMTVFSSVALWWIPMAGAPLTATPIASRAPGAMTRSIFRSGVTSSPPIPALKAHVHWWTIMRSIWNSLPTTTGNTASTCNISTPLLKMMTSLWWWRPTPCRITTPVAAPHRWPWSNPGTATAPTTRTFMPAASQASRMIQRATATTSRTQPPTSGNRRWTTTSAPKETRWRAVSISNTPSMTASSPHWAVVCAWPNASKPCATASTTGADWVRAGNQISTGPTWKKSQVRNTPW